MHPSCRYDGFCTRLDCPFTHVIKKPSAVVPAVASAVSISNKTTSLILKSDDTEAPSATTTPIASVTNLASSTSEIGPKITINKIQPFYSLVNTPSNAANSTANTLAVKGQPSEKISIDTAKGVPAARLPSSHPFQPSKNFSLVKLIGKIGKI